jgi:hypothetical protein
MLALFFMVLWLITQHLYQETPAWRTPRTVATVKVERRPADHLDVHKARDQIVTSAAAGR